jgi:hypothetical protein
MNMLSKWEMDTDRIKDILTQFQRRMVELKAEYPNEPDKMIAIVMEEMLETERTKRQRQDSSRSS